MERNSTRDLEKTTTSDTQAADFADNVVVRQSGYAPAYRRVFKSIGTIAVPIAMASPLSAIFVCSSYMVVYGGYWGLTWGWVIAGLLLIGQPLALAELCSSMPINGALYWWTAALAPRYISRPLSFVIGWVMVLSSMASLASFAFALGSTYASLISSLCPNWIPTNAEQFGLSVAILALWLVLNLIKMERFILVVMATVALILATIFAYIIGLPASHAAQGRPFATGKLALGSYANVSEWSAPVAAQMTFFGFAWSVTGWQSPAFVAEETKDAEVTAPRAIIFAYCLMAGMGALVCWVAAFCISDLEAIALDPTGLPMFGLMIEHWGEKPAAAFLIICMSCTVLGGSSFLFSSSCACAAFARDGGLPYAKHLSTVNKKTNMPIVSAVFLLSGGFLILLLSLLPAAARIIYSLAVITILVTFAVPFACRLSAGSRFRPGRFSYGRWSMFIHSWALVVTIYMLVVSCFPATPDWTVGTFNYNWVVAGGVILLATAAWFAHGTVRFREILAPVLDGLPRTDVLDEVELAVVTEKN